MPIEPTAPVMGGPTEPEVLSEPSVSPGAEPQASGTSPEAAPPTASSDAAPASDPAPTDWKAKQKEDETLRQHIKDEANRLAQKLLARQERRAVASKASKAVEEADPDAALEVASRVPDLLRDDDEDDADLPAPLRADFAAQDQQARAILAEVYEDFEPEAKELYAAHQKEWDAKYQQGPLAFAQWVKAETLNARIDARAKALAKALTPAIQEEATNALLRTTPTPLTGGTGSAADDAAFLEQYEQGKSNDHARAQKALAALR